MKSRHCICINKPGGWWWVCHTQPHSAWFQAYGRQFRLSGHESVSHAQNLGAWVEAMMYRCQRGFQHQVIRYHVSQGCKGNLINAHHCCWNGVQSRVEWDQQGPQTMPRFCTVHVRTQIDQPIQVSCCAKAALCHENGTPRIMYRITNAEDHNGADCWSSHAKRSSTYCHKVWW